MRFPRNNRIFRGQFDAAPFAGVFFLLVLFLLLHPAFVFVPGVPLHLPEAVDLPGTDRPTVVVAVDEGGQFYFANQVCDEATLAEKLKEAATLAREPLTLVVRADEDVKYKVLARLWLIARNAGIRDMLQATRPPLVPAAAPKK